MLIFYSVFASATITPVESQEKSDNSTQRNAKSEGVGNDNILKNSKFDANETTSKSNIYSNPNFIFFDNQTGFINFGLPSFWKDQFKACNTNFKCTANYSTGWKDDISFQLSTTNNTKKTFSNTYGHEMDVKIKEHYQLVTHMKLNKWTTQSHVALEGFNETSKGWSQIIQCPSGINGPLEWEEFSCIMTIPENITKIRPVLIAGWSSQTNKEATTWFDSINIIKINRSITDPNLKDEVVYYGLEFPTRIAFLGPDDFSVSELSFNSLNPKNNLFSDPDFIFLDNQSGLVKFGTPSFWEDQFNSCITNFYCYTNSSTGWNDNTSLQVSTTNNTKNTWSSIYGREIDVKPIDHYEFITHMKVNKWATQSHVALEGFNDFTKIWYQIIQCPSGINGPLEWEEFACDLTIPENTTKIRPVLIAGASQPEKEATSWFDSIYLVKSSSFIVNPELKAEVVYQGLNAPTNMAFLGPDDILVLEKDEGTVQRIVNGVKVEKPLVDLSVARHDGLTGIAVAKNFSANLGSNNPITYIFLYFTASETDGGDLLGKKPLGNYVYRYELVNNKLENPKAILELPAGSEHNGGEILIGPDNYLYVMIGEVYTKNPVRTNALNENGTADGRGGILRIDQDGKGTNNLRLLGDNKPLDMYYAYGIRNSFGFDFDPVTGNLWDTENGPNYGDEINIVKPGFNSGWDRIQGIWTVPGQFRASEEPNGLVDFDGKGKYSSPEFTWNQTVGPTALKFFSSEKLGKQYENDLFVADVNFGRIYHFELNEDRTELFLKPPLDDKVADRDSELANAVFAQGFGMITDLQVGPDGYLYFVSIDLGKIYRMVPGNMEKALMGYIDELHDNSLLHFIDLIEK